MDKGNEKIKNINNEAKEEIKEGIKEGNEYGIKYKEGEEIEEQPEEEKKLPQHLIFGIIAGVVIITLILILSFNYFYKPKIKTLDDMHKEIIEKNIDTDTAYSYNKFTFLKKDGMWYTQIVEPNLRMKFDIPLHFGPREVEDIPIYGNPSAFLFMASANNLSNFTNQAYVTFDPAGNDLGYIALTNGELGINLAEVMHLALIPACTNDNDPSCLRMNVPILTCENTTYPVFYLKEDNESKVLIEDDCITIQGRGYGIVKAADRFLYKIYGIMD